MHHAVQIRLGNCSLLRDPQKILCSCCCQGWCQNPVMGYWGCPPKPADQKQLNHAARSGYIDGRNITLQLL